MSIQKEAKSRSQGPVFVSIVDLAERWGVSYPTIVRSIRDGRLKAVMVGRRMKIHISEVERVEKAGV